MCIKSEFKEIWLKLATNGRSDKGFLLTSKVCSQGVFCPCPRAIYMYKIIKNVYKIRFWRDHFETCIIWAKRKGLSVVIKILTPMDCLPCPGLYTPEPLYNTVRYYTVLDITRIRVEPQITIEDFFSYITYAFYSRYHTVWIANTEISLDPNNGVIKRLWCTYGETGKKMYIKSDLKTILFKSATNGQSDKGFLLTSKVCPQVVVCPCPGAIYIYKIIKNVFKIILQRDCFKTCNKWAK